MITLGSKKKSNCCNAPIIVVEQTIPDAVPGKPYRNTLKNGFKCSKCGKGCTIREDNNPKPFHQYKKLVESIEYKGWRIELDDVAKLVGELSLSYKYQAYKKTAKGTTYMPFRGKICTAPDDVLDNRCQESKEWLLRELKRIVDQYAKEKNKKSN